MARSIAVKNATKELQAQFDEAMAEDAEVSERVMTVLREERDRALVRRQRYERILEITREIARGSSATPLATVKLQQTAEQQHEGISLDDLAAFEAHSDALLVAAERLAKAASERGDEIDSVLAAIRDVRAQTVAS